MNTHYFKVMGIFVLLLTAVLSPAVATTYKLVKVTSVEAGKMYVFEQGGHVMSNTIESNALKTTATYNTSNLKVTDSYVWTLESSGDYYKLKNLSKNDKQYLLNASSSANLSFSNTGTRWSFSFQEDGTALIQNKENDNNNNRFLAYTYIEATSELIYTYKSWAASYLATDKYHSINVYQLVAESEDVTVTTAGMATYVSNNNLDYSGVEGLKAYKAKVNGNDITFTAVGQVPAGEGVLLKATTTLAESTVYTIPVATTSVSAWSADDNDFIRGTGAAVPSYSEEGSYYNYILNKKGGVVGFYKAAGQTVAANRAYLRTTAAPSTSANAMSFSFEESTTGIKEDGIAKRDNQFADAEWYDLQGRKLSNIPTVAGLYIVNGKKVVVK